MEEAGTTLFVALLPKIAPEKLFIDVSTLKLTYASDIFSFHTQIIFK